MVWILDLVPLEYKEHWQRWTLILSISYGTTIWKGLQPGLRHRKSSRTRDNPCLDQCLDQGEQNLLQLSSLASTSPGEKRGFQYTSNAFHTDLNIHVLVHVHLNVPPCHWHRSGQWETQSLWSPPHCRSFPPDNWLLSSKIWLPVTFRILNLTFRH